MKAGGMKRSQHEPELAPGKGVFVNKTKYQAHQTKYGKIVDVRNLTGVMCAVTARTSP
jgi:hypothetical protein